MQIVNSFTITPEPAKRCDGCGVIVGKDHPVHQGLMVKSGPMTGFFHNHQCFQNKWKEANPDEDLQF